jgi:hypothetical protein
MAGQWPARRTFLTQPCGQRRARHATGCRAVGRRTRSAGRAPAPARRAPARRAAAARAACAAAARRPGEAPAGAPGRARPAAGRVALLALGGAGAGGAGRAAALAAPERGLRLIVGESKLLLLQRGALRGGVVAA